MTMRQADFCDFRDLKVLVISWNIDSAKPSDLAGSDVNVRFLEDCLNSVKDADIVVFGFQEVVDLSDKKLTASLSISARHHRSELSTQKPCFSVARKTALRPIVSQWRIGNGWINCKPQRTD